MKKLLAFTLCFIMVLSCSIPAFAAELPYNEATGQSTVTYQVDSSFCVIIPETVDAFNGFQLTASDMNITEAEQVTVSVNGENSIPMTNDEGDTFNLRLNVNDSDHVAEFVKNQTTSEFIVTGQPIEGEMPAAGLLHRNSRICCRAWRKTTAVLRTTEHKGCTVAVIGNGVFICPV